MRTYSQLADLESLLLTIPDENIRTYAGESIASYSVGAYRSSIVSIWIAVVYDLYQKFRYLDEQFGDAAAKKCISEIDNIRSKKDKKQVSAWERTILDNALNDVKMLTTTEYDHLNRIQQDRHRCAHPVLDDEGFLFQPSPELTRSHIRTAIEILLKQPAIIGKAAIEAFTRDVEGRYFPNDFEGISNALLNRHILPASEKYKINLIKYSLKKILFLEPDEKTIIARYTLALKCLIYSFTNGIEAIDRVLIRGFIERTKEDRIQYLPLLYNIDNGFLDNTPEHIKEKFEQFLQNDATESHKAYIIHLFPDIKSDLKNKYPESISVTSRKNLIKCLIFAEIYKKDEDFAKFIIKTNIDKFSKSSTFASGRDNAENYLKPIIQLLNESDIEYLISQIIENQTGAYDQLEDCASYMEEIFVETIDKYPKTIQLWKDFIMRKSAVWQNMENLKNLVQEYHIPGCLS